MNYPANETEPTALYGRRAISLIQPWATLIVAGVKRYETRSWETPYRGSLLIHASKKIDNAYLAMPEVATLVMEAGLTSFPTGAILGETLLGGCLPTDVLADLVSEKELLLGDFGPGRFAWAMRRTRQWQAPVKCRGSLGIWTVNAARLVD